MTTTPEPTADEDLRELLRTGDLPGAFEGVMRRYRDRVFRLACSYLRDASQAEDVVQDIFLRVWKGLSGYSGEASLSTWLYAIARNSCLTELKRRAARAAVSLDDQAVEEALGVAPELQTMDSEAGQGLDVQVLMRRLPEKYRRVVVLFYFEQRAYEEVAAMLGMPLGTVKTLLHRAKKELMRHAARPPAALSATP